MKSNTKLILGIAGGLVLGGILGLLFAPSKGEETRNRIKETGKKFAGQAEDLFSGVKSKFSGMKAQSSDGEPKPANEPIFE